MCDKGFKEQTEAIMSHVSVPVQVKTIPSGKLRRYAHFSWWHYVRHFSIVLHNIADIAKTAVGFVKSLWIVARFRPDVVFAKGGFVCLPVGLAAKALGVPLVIHDSDVRPGLTNKLLARFATAIATGMPIENYGYNSRITTQVGVPINPVIERVSTELRKQYRTELELPLDKKIVVAVGGGLGSVAINRAIIGVALARKDDASVLFYNVTGVRNIDDAKAHTAELSNYEAVPFVYKDIYRLLGAADIVVTRASATTLQELAGLGQTVIAVPARQLGDQQKNAELFARYDAVFTLQDDELNERLGVTLDMLLRDKDKCHELAANLYAFARPHAARDMADIILSSR